MFKAVYPRWRGEHMVWGFVAAYQSGLSPLARGTQVDIFSAGPHFRFIPAGAGNTTKTAHLQHYVTVYPRWRGEHIRDELNALRPHGLSPLARGTLSPAFPGLYFFRFIPAGAGNTIVKG